MKDPSTANLMNLNVMESFRRNLAQRVYTEIAEFLEETQESKEVKPVLCHLNKDLELDNIQESVLEVAERENLEAYTEVKILASAM